MQEINIMKFTINATVEVFNKTVYCIIRLNLTWPLREQAAYNQATWVPTALSHFRGTSL